MFSGSSVHAAVRPCVRASVIHVVVLCFRDISSICWRIFAKLLSLVHLGTQMNWLDFGVNRSKFKVTAWPNTSQIFMFPLYPVSIDRFSPNFCHWCILGHRWPDYVFGSKGQSSRSHHRGRGAQNSTLPSSATFSSFSYFLATLSECRQSIISLSLIIDPEIPPSLWSVASLMPNVWLPSHPQSISTLWPVQMLGDRLNLPTFVTWR